MAVKKYCDKCGNEIVGLAKVHSLIEKFSKQTWDLCDLCYKGFIEYISKTDGRDTSTDKPF